MKPFLYALALEMGFAPASVLPDVPSDFGGDQVYVPLNFDNSYNGPVLLRNALASSLNVPAVYVLYRVGIDNYFSKLEALGFESLAGTRENTGLSLALGSGEVTLYELVRAFSVFARDGSIPELTTIAGGVAGVSPAEGGVHATERSGARGRGETSPLAPPQSRQV
jgi:penicillin-binding protein 1C